MKNRILSFFVLTICSLLIVSETKAQVNFSCEQIGSGCPLDENVMIA